MALNRGNVTRTVMENPVEAVNMVDEAEETSILDTIPNPRMMQAPMPAIQPSRGMATHDVVQSTGSFADLEISFSSFPYITLDKGTFKIDGEPHHSPFEVRILSTSVKYIVKGTKQPDRPGAKREEEFVYSRDCEYTYSGEPVSNYTREWEQRGWTVSIKKYKEATAVMGSGDEASLVILSIPPTSIGKMDGYIASLRALKGLNPDQVITRVTAGPLVGNGADKFSHWLFDFVRVVRADEVKPII